MSWKRRAEIASGLRDHARRITTLRAELKAEVDARNVLIREGYRLDMLPADIAFTLGVSRQSVWEVLGPDAATARAAARKA